MSNKYIGGHTMAIITSFANSNTNSPEWKIYNTVQTALNFISVCDFINLVMSNISNNLNNLSISQKLSLKLVAVYFCGKPNINIDEILLFILYGKFQELGIGESEVDSITLTPEQRLSVLEQIYLTAKDVINQKINELNNIVSWIYENPDFLPNES